MSLEDIFGNLDKWFLEKKASEVNIIYTLIIVCLITLSYETLWDSAEQGYNRTLSQKQKIQKKLTDDLNYLKWNPVSKITQIKTQTDKYKQQFVELKDQSEYIKYKIEQISSLYYDEKAWGEFIDSISENAKKYGVQLEHLSNKFSDKKRTFGHILDIEVEIEGGFHKTMSFINSLEQSFLVVDIHDIDIKAENGIKTNLKLSVWGIAY